MTIIDQILASLRDEPESWTYQPNMNGHFIWKGGSALDADETILLNGTIHARGRGWPPTTMTERYRNRRAVRKWQRRVM